LKEYLKEFLSSVDIDFSDKDKVKSLIVYMTIALGIVVALAYYTNSIINSLDTLSNLKYQQKYLEKEIDRLQDSNANLQKEYFELKNLEPEF
jgi:peptidoglycan hydrolase CwlO-like protein